MIFEIIFLLHKNLMATQKLALLILQRLERNGFGALRYPRHNRERRVSIPKGSITLSSFRSSVFSLTGLGREEFLFILKGTASAIRAPRKRPHSLLSRDSPPQISGTILTTAVRLIAALNFLKYYPSRHNLEQTFHVHWKTLWMDRHHVIPIVSQFLIQHSSIVWSLPSSQEELAWAGASMVIDCTSHIRNRVHPGHAFYYRGDKHTTFLSAQMVCDLIGSRIVCYDLLRGHNNDQGVFNISGLRDLVESEGKRLLGDGGYQHGFIVTQKDVPFSQRPTLQFLRGIVEIIFGLVHSFQAATTRFRESVGFQVECLIAIYELIGWRLRVSPIRPQLLHTSMAPSILRPCDPTPIVSARESEEFDLLVHRLQDQSFQVSK